MWAKPQTSGRPVLGLELVQEAAVDEAGDDLARVIRGAAVGGHGAVETRSGRPPAARPRRRCHGAGGFAGSVATIERTIAQRLGVVGGEVVDDAGGAGVELAAAELLGAHLLAGRRLHQRRPAEEDRPLVRATITVSSLIAGT